MLRRCGVCVRPAGSVWRKFGIRPQNSDPENHPQRSGLISCPCVYFLPSSKAGSVSRSTSPKHAVPLVSPSLEPTPHLHRHRDRWVFPFSPWHQKHQPHRGTAKFVCPSGAHQYLMSVPLLRQRLLCWQEQGVSNCDKRYFPISKHRDNPIVVPTLPKSPGSSKILFIPILKLGKQGTQRD